MSEETHGVRLDRVETEVGAIRSDMGSLKTDMGRLQADVKGLGAILGRIEQGVLRNQEQQDEREKASRHSPVQVATVLVTIMSILVGGAWMVGSTTASTSARLSDQDHAIGQMMALRDRELDAMERRIDRVEDGGRKGGQSGQAN